MADSSGNKHGTTTIHSEDSFQSVRPKFIPSQNATAIEDHYSAQKDSYDGTIYCPESGAIEKGVS